ncbi:Hpt domain-containing protein [Sulfurimonas sp.]|uniref:Hpt domain-containing protein n=1 Tax=Sulfurimonas sp. TaxID=2022749 RepID=UPI0025D7FBE3|nr:Hpt domain-containing protein [Sulfurimonas sp.]
MPILTPNYANISHEDMANAIGLKIKHIPMLLSSFLQETPPILQALEDAINEKDYPAIKEHAHGLKGSSGNLRFNEIYEMSKELEFAGADANQDFEYEAYLQAIKDAVATISSD